MTPTADQDSFGAWVVVCDERRRLPGTRSAPEYLRRFWKRVSLDGALSPVQQHLFNSLSFWCRDGSPAHLWLGAWIQDLSSYETLRAERVASDPQERTR